MSNNDDMIGYDPLSWMKEDNSEDDDISSQAHSLIILEENTTISDINNLHNQLKSLDYGAGKITLDASEVSNIDTGPLQLLAAFCNYTTKNNIKLELVNPSDFFINSAKMLNLTKLLQHKKEVQ